MRNLNKNRNELYENNSQTELKQFLWVLLIGIIFIFAITQSKAQTSCSIVFTQEPVDVTFNCEEADSIENWLVDYGYARAYAAPPFSINSVTASHDLDDITPGENEVTFTFFSNGCDTTSRLATITVIDNERPTVVKNPDPITIECLDDPAFQNWLKNNAGAVFDDNCCLDTVTNTFTGDYNCNNGTVIYFTAIDCAGNKRSIYEIFYLNDTVAPDIDPADDVVLPCGDNTSVVDSLLTINGGNTAYDCNNKVRWSNNFTGDYPSEDGDSLKVTFTAMDHCGNSSSVSQIYTVECDPCQNDTIRPTVVETPDPITIECLDDPAFQAWIDNNAGAVFADNCCLDTVVNSFDGRYNCINGTVIYFTAIDCAGNERSIYEIFYLEDTVAPTTNVADDIVLPCGNNETVVDSFLAINGGNTAYDCNNQITWSNDFNGIYPSKDGDSLEVTYTATDGCDNSSSISQIFSVECDTVPVDTSCQISWSFVPDSLVLLNCGETIPGFEVTATSSGCSNSDTISISYEETRTNGCPAILQRFATAFNRSDTIEFTQTVEIWDTTAPIFNYTVDDTLFVECGDSLNQIVNSVLQIRESVEDCQLASVVDNYIGQTIECNDTIEVSVTATDSCGNSSQESFIAVIGEDTDTTNVECNIPIVVDIDPIQCHGEMATVSFVINTDEYLVETMTGVELMNYTVRIGPGEYEFMAKSRDQSCQNDSLISLTIIEPPLLESSVEVLQDKSCSNPLLNDGQATVIVSGGVRPYQFDWSESIQQDSLVDDLPEGEQEVTVTDANGCQVTNDFFLPCDSCKMWVSGDLLYCSFNVPEDETFDAEVTIFSYSGREVLTVSVPVVNGYGYREIDISQLKAARIYIGQADLNRGRTKVIKFVKQ